VGKEMTLEGHGLLHAVAGGGQKIRKRHQRRPGARVQMLHVLRRRRRGGLCA
jgi:hypothetical protein